MPEIKISAELRTEFGKGAARRIRRDHKIPAVLYSHGAAPVHVTLPGHATMMALKHANALLTIGLDGKDQLALPKDVQRDPVRDLIEHVDLLVVRRGEKVQVEVPVRTVGEAAPETVVTLEHQTLLVEAEATHIPGHVEVSIEGLSAGTQIHAGAVELPEGTTLVTDAEAMVVNVSQAITAEALEAELAAAEEQVGIVHEPAEKEAEAAEGAAEGAPAGEGAAAEPAAGGDSPE